MSVIEAMRVSATPMRLLAAVGVFWGAVAGLMPDLKAQIGASDAFMGTVLMAPAVGSLGALWAAPVLMARLGGRLVGLIMAVMLAAFLAPAYAPDALRMAAALVLAGAAVAFADIAANVLVSQREAALGRHLMNVNHAMFSLAFGLTALAVAPARAAGLGPREILPVLALIALGLLAPALRTRERLSEGDEGGRRALALPHGAVGLAALILLAAFIGENATEAWSALHVERTFGAPVGSGALGPAVLGLSMATVRMGGQLLSQRLGEVRLIVASALAGVVGALVIALAPGPGVVLAGAGLMGLGMAVIVPTTNTLLGRRVDDRVRARAISRAWMAGMAGFFLGPAMMGLVAEVASLRVSFALVALVVALIVPAVRALAAR